MGVRKAFDERLSVTNTFLSKVLKQPRSLGKAIWAIRKHRGFSQDKLAQCAGVRSSFISMLENGQKNVSPQVLEKIMEALDTPVAFVHLLADTSDAPVIRVMQETAIRTLEIWDESDMLRELKEIPAMSN